MTVAPTAFALHPSCESPDFGFLTRTGLPCHRPISRRRAVKDVHRPSDNSGSSSSRWLGCPPSDRSRSPVPGRQDGDSGPPEPGGSTPSGTSMLSPTHPVSCGRNPIAFSSLRSAFAVYFFGQDVNVKGDVEPNNVVHVVQESVVRAAQKTHATRSTTVNSGLLRSMENADHAASSCKGAGRKVGPRHCAFFCQGEGRGFESRRPLQRIAGQRHISTASCF